MFCGNCGTNNDAGTVFCENCGARLEPEVQPIYTQPQQQPYQPQYQQTYQPEVPAKKKSKLPMIFGIILLLIVIALVCVIIVGEDDGINDSAENAAIAFVEGLTDNDPDKAIDAVYPEMEGIEREIRDQCEELKEDMEENDIVCDNHRVIDSEDCDEDIPDAEEYLEDYYNASASIDDLKLLVVRVDRTSGDASDKTDINVYVAKIDGKWYVIRTE